MVSRGPGAIYRNLPGARGFVAIEYGPVASHGDPFIPKIIKLFEGVCFKLPSSWPPVRVEGRVCYSVTAYYPPWCPPARSHIYGISHTYAMDSHHAI